MPIELLRDQFPALREKTFLDAACVSLAPRAAIEAVQRFLEQAATCPAPSSTQHHLEMDALREAARPEAARLINAGVDEIALVESTTHGLTLAAQSLPLDRGDRVLLCDLEYLQVAIPWCQLRESAGIEIDLVASREGRILIQDIVDRIGSRTRVVAVSSVQWCNGFRCDLDALGAACRQAGVWLLVDAVQHLGAVPLDVRRTPVDMLACGGHKWLNSPLGTGLFYVSRQALERLRPVMAGYMSLEPPEGGWAHYFQTPGITPLRPYRFVKEARRFEIGGTANYAGAIALAAALKLLNDLGPDAVWRHILRLTDHLLGGLRALGVTVVTPPESESRSGIVTFSVGDAGRNLTLMRHLLERRILVSVRYTSHVGGVRVSCHFFNTNEDLDRLLEAVEDWRKRPS
jgi:selenocysteine lyase/cysteine desulfurase